MSTVWGYRVPVTPTLKSFRPAHRAARGKCAVVDTSYFGVIELDGRKEGIVRVLERITAGRFAGPR
jgi:ribonuclease P/MRP protein subunit POP1